MNKPKINIYLNKDELVPRIYPMGDGVTCTGTGTIVGFGVLTIQYILPKHSPKKVGAKIKKNQLDESTKCTFLFYETKDVDNMILRLKEIKKEMKEYKRKNKSK